MTKAIKGDKRKLKATENEHFLMNNVQCDKKNVIWRLKIIKIIKNNSTLKSILKILHVIKQLKEDITCYYAT